MVSEICYDGQDENGESCRNTGICFINRSAINKLSRNFFAFLLPCCTFVALRLVSYTLISYIAIFNAETYETDC